MTEASTWLGTGLDGTERGLIRDRTNQLQKADGRNDDLELEAILNLQHETSPVFYRTRVLRVPGR